MDRRKIMYSILKEIEKGEKEPKAVDYDLSSKQFQNVVRMMQEGNLINGAAFSASITWLNTASITLAGLNYLEENSAWARGYLLAKEIRDWIK